MENTGNNTNAENNSNNVNTDNNLILLFQKLLQNIKPGLDSLTEFYAFNHEEEDEEDEEEDEEEEDDEEEEEDLEDEDPEKEDLEEDDEEEDLEDEDLEEEEEKKDVKEGASLEEEDDINNCILCNKIVEENDEFIVDEEHNLKIHKKCISNKEKLDELLEEVSKDFFNS